MHRPEDLTTKKGKSIIVINTQNVPVVVNELGQQLGGQRYGTVTPSDPFVRRAIAAGFLLVIS